jgi:hypothetical protein
MDSRSATRRARLATRCTGKFDFEPQQVTLADCIAEVLHQRERLGRLDLAIDRAIELAPPEKKAVVEALQGDALVPLQGHLGAKGCQPGSGGDRLESGDGKLCLGLEKE